MPTDTWRNLDPGKRQRVLDQALREFASRGYTAGSLNTISRRARVSKGSLFQYFDDKLDLWTTIVDFGASQMGKSLLPKLEARRHLSFDRQLHGLVEDWLSFLLQRPAQQAGAVAINREPDQAAREIAREITSSHLDRLIEPILERGFTSGFLRQDVARRLISTQLILLLRHLAAAPFQPGEDPTLDLSFNSEQHVREAAAELTRAYLRAWQHPGRPAHEQADDNEQDETACLATTASSPDFETTV